MRRNPPGPEPGSYGIIDLVIALREIAAQIEDLTDSVGDLPSRIAIEMEALREKREEELR